MKPNPGSKEAIDQGCTCPVMDNDYGKGAYGTTDTFWINEHCPLHANQQQDNENQDNQDQHQG